MDRAAELFRKISQSSDAEESEIDLREEVTTRLMSEFEALKLKVDASLTPEAKDLYYFMENKRLETFYKTHCPDNMPYIRAVIRRLFSHRGSSAGAERFFSMTGQIMNQLRGGGMDSDTLEMLSLTRFHLKRNGVTYKIDLEKDPVQAFGTY